MEDEKRNANDTYERKEKCIHGVDGETRHTETTWKF